VTTQSSQAAVSRSVQHSQSTVSPPSGSLLLMEMAVVEVVALEVVVLVSLVIGMSLTLSVCPHGERGL
jgi:hypothetical protein